MSETTRTPEATPTGGAHSAPGSLEEAAAAFRGILAPKGTPKKPGESKPKSDALTVPEDEESEDATPADDEATDETEADDSAPADETTDDSTESDSEEQTDDAEDDEADSTPETRSRKLKFSDGTEAEVSEDEAYQGYLRTKDYTHKTQRAAEQLKKAQAAEATWNERAAEMAHGLEQVKTAMSRLVPKEPNWVDLRKKLTPEQFANAVEDWKAFEAEQKQVDADLEKVNKARAEKQFKDYEAWREQEFDALMAALPEWVDPKLAQKEAGEMGAYAKSVGFSDEEVNTAVDHRYLLLFRKAMLWDRAQQNAGKVKPKIQPKGSVKTAPPGGKKPAPKPKSDLKKAQDSLRQSGSMADAASVFSHVIRRGR